MDTVKIRLSQDGKYIVDYGKHTYTVGTEYALGMMVKQLLNHGVLSV